MHFKLCVRGVDVQQRLDAKLNLLLGECLQVHKKENLLLAPSINLKAVMM